VAERREGGHEAARERSSGMRRRRVHVAAELFGLISRLFGASVGLWVGRVKAARKSEVVERASGSKAKPKNSFIFFLRGCG